MAKSSILEIIIKLAKAGDADKATIKSLSTLKMGVSQAMGAFAALAGVAYTVNKALDATVGQYVAYGQKVRDAKIATGLSADEMSRVIALADDLGVSYESLSASIQKNADTTDFSVEGLARASAEYLSLATAQERSMFAQQQFGKQWSEFSKILEKGPDQIREMAAAVDEGHLFDDDDLSAIEEYRMQLDQLNDQVEATKMSIGQGLVPVVNDLLFQMNHSKEIFEERNRLMQEGEARDLTTANNLAVLNVKIREYTDGLDSAGVSYRAMAEAATQGNDVLLQTGETMDQVNQRNQDMLSLIFSLQTEQENYNESLAGLTEKMNALKTEQEGYLAGSEKYNEIQAEIDQTGAAVEKLAADHEAASKRIAFSLLQQKLAVDGLSDAEFKSLLVIGQQWGVIDEKTASAAMSMNAQIDELSYHLSEARHETNLLHNQVSKFHALSGQTTDIFININVSGAIPSGLGHQVAKPGTTVSALAEGGQIGKGWTMVGEKGFELVSPTGYVFTNAESQALLASGLVPEQGLVYGGPLFWDDARRPASPTGARASGSSTRRNKNRNDGEVAPPSTGNATSQTVAEAVAPMAETTASAVQSATQAQQVTVAIVNDLKNAQEESNTIMQGIRDDLKHNSATMKNSFLAGVEQMRG